LVENSKHRVLLERHPSFAAPIVEVTDTFYAKHRVVAGGAHEKA
jgi:hypothetical protein